MRIIHWVSIFVMTICISCKKEKSITVYKTDSSQMAELSNSNTMIQSMVNAINANDIMKIESLRDEVKTEHIDALIPLWDIELSWKTKDGFTFLMCDQNDPRLKPMMKEALNSPLEDSQAYGLCFLQEKNCDFNSLLTSEGLFDKAEINRQIKALKK